MLKDDLVELVKQSIKNKSLQQKTLVEITYKEIADKMKIAATNGNTYLSYSFKFLPDDRDNTAREVVLLLINNGIVVKQIFPDDKYFFELRWNE